MNTLVAYFSASGVTAAAAKNLAEAAGADLYEIKPAVPYTDSDLDWRDRKSRSSMEMRDLISRPAISDRETDLSGYDTIFLGFPIWWYVAPTIINTFLESRDFSGKKIIVFATSGGSDLEKSAENLRESAPGAEIIKGRMMNGSPSVSELADWVKEIKAKS